MKKVTLIILILSLVLLLVGFTAHPAKTNQDIAHEIAQLARSLGLSEDDPIIQRAQEIWWENDAQYQQDMKILANVVYYEARGCPSRHRQLVAQVVLNRVADPRFPNTVKEVVEQPGQYSPSYVTANPDIPEEIYDDVRAAMNGEVDCPANVIYQAQFTQGTGIYEVSYVDTGWYSSTTYFCYG